MADTPSHPFQEFRRQEMSDSDSESSGRESSDSQHPPPPKLAYRYCRTPDCGRVIGAWLLFEDVNERYSCDNGWAIPETPLPAPYEIREIEGKGRGMIAVRDIKANELIICERPVFVMPASRFVGFTWRDMEKEALLLLYLLEQEDRRKLLRLHNCKSPEECGPLAGIIRTNGLATPFTDSKVTKYYTSVCLDISLVNHSCAPNASWDFEEKDITFSVRAKKDITAGEEITISYVGEIMMRADRQAELQQKYRFTCACSLCSRSDAENAASDERRKFILATGKALRSGAMIKNWLQCPKSRKKAQTKHDVETVEKFLRMLEIEGVDTKHGRIKAMAHCMSIYGADADVKNFKKWARRLLSYNKEEEDVEKWIEDPRSFPMWNDLHLDPMWDVEVPVTVVSPEDFLRVMDEMHL